MRIIVAGGGASGLMAALAAKQQGAEDVLILERGGEIGKKILSTGSGRCNLTNENQSPDCYHSSLPGSFGPVLSQFSKEDTVRFFEENGLHLKAKNGYYYPRNAQALSVRDFLRDCCRKAGVRVELNRKITRVAVAEAFQVTCEDGALYGCDRLILAGGGKAAPQTGSDGGMFAIARRLGHTLVTPVPALTPLCVRKEELKFFRAVGGTRADGRIRLVFEKEEKNEVWPDTKKKNLKVRDNPWNMGKETSLDEGIFSTSETVTDCGEIQFTDYGLSGIPAFNVSAAAGRALAAGRKCERPNGREIRVSAEVDFLPEITPELLRAQFDSYRERYPEDTFRMWLRGYLPTKLAEALLALVGIPPALYLRKCSDREAEKLLHALKGSRFALEGTGTFEKAQTTSGGIDMREVDLHTLESKHVPGLYFAGEILDVDGICGGYNLQWAWSSGVAAGKAAAKER